MITLLRKIVAPWIVQQTHSARAENVLISLEDIAGFLPSNPVIVEAGAHVGIDSLHMSAFWPECTIHAFEPVPDLFKKLTTNSRNIKNIHCYPYALGDCNTVAELYISSGDSDGSSSLLLPKKHLTEHPGVVFSTSIRIQTVTLDSWAAENKVPHVDFLWLDMQGYELHALKSAGSVLPAVRAIYTEVSLKEMYHGAPLYAELKQWLGDQGFSVYIESLPWEDMGNVLFVRSSLIK